MKKESSAEDQLVRRQLLLALAANRTPGFHFPGHFLGCAWPRIGDTDMKACDPALKRADA